MLMFIYNLLVDSSAQPLPLIVPGLSLNVFLGHDSAILIVPALSLNVFLGHDSAILIVPARSLNVFLALTLTSTLTLITILISAEASQ